jgi:hypothetical protein
LHNHLPRALCCDGNNVEWRERGMREELERDTFEARDVTPEMGVVDIDGHASPQA